MKNQEQSDVGWTGRGGKRLPRYRKGEWAVQRERLRLEEHRPSPDFRDATAMAAIIPGLMKRLGVEEAHWENVLEAEWPALVGTDVAKHTRPGRLDGARLSVFVDNSAWLSELARYGRKPMLANLQKRFGAGKIRAVSFQLDPDGGKR